MKNFFFEGARLQPCHKAAVVMTMALATEGFRSGNTCHSPRGERPPPHPRLTARLKPCPFKAGLKARTTHTCRIHRLRPSVQLIPRWRRAEAGVGRHQRSE